MKEFFPSVAYLGGNRTYNFIRGPVGYGQGECLNKNNLSTAGECRINLERHHQKHFENYKALIHVNQEFKKFLSLSHYKCCENSCHPKVKSLVLTDNLKVSPVAFGNDGTALKPSIQFDERAKVNIGLEDEIRLEYVKENHYLSKKELEHGIVTDALVSSITTLDNNCSLLVAIKYPTKTSKKGDFMKDFFTEQNKHSSGMRVMPEIYKEYQTYTASYMY